MRAESAEKLFGVRCVAQAGGSRLPPGGVPGQSFDNGELLNARRNPHAYMRRSRLVQYASVRLRGYAQTEGIGSGAKDREEPLMI